jgi:hypothetical protein
MHSFTRKTAVAAATMALTAIAASDAVAAVTPPSNGTQSFHVDSRSILSTKSPQELRYGKFYVATVSGVVSFYSQSVWTTPRKGRVVCGTTAPITSPSPLQGSGVGGVDAETLFAGTAQRGCGTPKAPFHWANFQVSTSGLGFTHPTPIGGARNSPTSDHSYSYVLKGLGTEARFRISDIRYSDNNGRLKVEIRRGTASDCRNGGWSHFDGFRNERDCTNNV